MARARPAPTSKGLLRLSGEIKTPPFSTEARTRAGVLLRRLQDGETLGMPLSRPMPDIGKHCHELRIRDADKNWRIFYRIDSDLIVIAEIGLKTTSKTPAHVIDLCQRRLSQYDQDIRDALRGGR